MDLTTKRILVAGAVSETGRVIVSQLDRLGAKVVMVDDSEGECQEIQKGIGSNNISSHCFKIYDNAEIETNFESIIKEFGAFNGFVYAAGIGGVRPLVLTKPQFVKDMMNANLYTFIEMVRCITKRNAFTPGGSIVAVSSVSSIRGLKSKTAYSASKAALDASVRCLAAELSNRRIRVNSILKGWVKADMGKDFIKDNMALNERDDLKRQLLGVIDTVEVANTVAFLLSDATKSITGTSLILDGGYTL